MKSRTGDISELRATLWLLDQGYEVYANVASTGSADMVIERDGALTRVDVKTLRSYRYRKLSPEQHRLGVKLLYVCDDGTCTWG